MDIVLIGITFVLYVCTGTSYLGTGTMVPRYGRIKKINSSVFPFTRCSTCLIRASPRDKLSKVRDESFVDRCFPHDARNQFIRFQ